MTKIVFYWLLQVAIINRSVWSAKEPDRRCLDCMCLASSGCKPNIKCHNVANGGYFCGPYQISWAYWADAGKPGDAGFANDFETCLNKKSCAESTVRGYMAKWGNDCNADGRVDCFDFAAIHKTGPGNCQQKWLYESKYWKEFNRCYLQSNPSSPSISSEENISNHPLIEIPKPSPLIAPDNSFISLPLNLPPVVARASASVPGASASASAGVDSSGIASTFASTSLRDEDNEVLNELIINSEDLHKIDNRFPPLPGSLNRPISGSLPARANPNRVHFSGPNLPIASARIPTPSSPRTLFIPPPIPPPPPPQRPRLKPIETENESSVIVSSNPIPLNNIRSTTTPEIHPNDRLPDENRGLEVVPYDCVQCLCHASSKCNLNKGCDGAYCGPYLLSWGYWADGGQPGEEYASCTKQKECSEKAIQGYMSKWKKDCNGDGKIDCIDYALIHKLGPHGCGKIEALAATDYWNQFLECPATSIKPTRSTRPLLINSTRPIEEFDQPTDVLRIRINNPSERFREFPQPPRPPPSSNIIHNSGPVGPQPPVLSIPPLPPPPPNPLANPRNHRFDEDGIRIISPRPSPQPLPQPQPTIIPRTQPQPSISRNDEFFSEPRPSDHSNDNSNVFEVPRRNQDEERIDPNAFAPRVPPSPSTQSRARLRNRQNSTTISPNFNRDDVINNECLECICYASSKCRASIGCRSDEPGRSICGPYQVDWEYWAEAGKPGNRGDLSNLENFQMCLNNRECADQTVREYLKRHRKDCNEDGTIDCNDFAAIHVSGTGQCNAQWYLDSKYYSDFRECYDF
ncbi:Lysozyme 3 [Sarcoptes scabiei]|nr:Lysozyme 3 [Sarcoptes scabiei]